MNIDTGPRHRAVVAVADGQDDNRSSTPKGKYGKSGFKPITLWVSVDKQMLACVLILLNVVMFSINVIGPSKFLPPGYFDVIVLGKNPSKRGGTSGISAATVVTSTELKSASPKALSAEPKTASTKTTQTSETPSTDTIELGPVDAEAFVKLLPYDISGPPPLVLPLFQTKDASIRHRHKCLRRIRRRHYDSLFPMFSRLGGLTDEILYVDPAYHNNVGDNMLSYAGLTFLMRLRMYDEIQECHYAQAMKRFPKCLEIIGKADAMVPKYAAWHAGGNWGDLYHNIQETRINSFELLLGKNYSVVTMPQSLFYQDESTMSTDADTIKNACTNGLGLSSGAADTPEGQEIISKRMSFVWREKGSYEIAQKMYPFATNLLVPDIAFQLGPFARKPPRVDIYFLLRKDKESVVPRGVVKHQAFRDAEVYKITGRNITSLFGDWELKNAEIDENDKYFTEVAIQLVSLGKVVICDRLHAAILCYITGIPFVYIDPVSGKISKTLGVAFDSWEGCQNAEASKWARSQNFTQAVELAVKFLDDMA